MVAPTITPAIIRAVKKFLKDKETKKRKKKVSESRKAQRIGLTRKEKVKKHKESFKKYGMREKYTLPGQRNIFNINRYPFKKVFILTIYSFKFLKFQLVKLEEFLMNGFDDQLFRGDVDGNEGMAQFDIEKKMRELQLGNEI